MAKPAYSIRAAIDRNFLNHEITIPIGGINTKASPVKQLLFFGGGVLVILWAATSTWIQGSGAFWITVFILWGLIAVIYLGGLTKTKELRMSTIPALLAYVPREARQVRTRRNSNPSGFYSIVGIDSIDPESGGINFADGTVGQAYIVVGSASNLLFDEDRSAILDRVDAYWRKVEPTAEWIFITTREPQRIYRQVAALEARNQNLQIRDPDLLELQNEQYDILTEYVGGKFTSIHQYVVIKGKTADALHRAHMILQAEVEGSSLMIKEATMLDGEETLTMLRTFYQGVDANPFASRTPLNA